MTQTDNTRIEVIRSVELDLAMKEEKKMKEIKGVEKRNRKWRIKQSNKLRKESGRGWRSNRK